MGDEQDREIADLLEHVFVAASPTFWDDVEAAIGAATAEPLSATDDEQSERVDDVALSDVVSLAERRSRRVRWLAPASAVAAAIVAVGLYVALRPPSDADSVTSAAVVVDATAPPTSLTPTSGASPSTNPSTTTPTTSSSVPPTVAVSSPASVVDPVSLGVAGRVVVLTDDRGGFGGLELAGPDGATVIGTAHDLDVAGQALGTNVVSDGAGGFVYGLIDYDDSRPDRATRLLHVAAGASRPRVVTIEDLDGIGQILGVLGTDEPIVVYTTLLGSRTRAVPLVGGQVADVSALDGAAARGDVIAVIGLDVCRPLSLVGVDGSPSPLVLPLELGSCEAGFGPVHEVALSPDGRSIAWFTEESSLLRIDDLRDGSRIAEVDVGAADSHIVAFDGERVLVGQSTEAGIDEIVVAISGVIDRSAPAASQMSWETYMISDELVLSLR